MTRTDLIAAILFEAAESGDVRPEMIQRLSGCSARTAQRKIRWWNRENVKNCRLNFHKIQM